MISINKYNIIDDYSTMNELRRRFDEIVDTVARRIEQKIMEKIDESGMSLVLSRETASLSTAQVKLALLKNPVMPAAKQFPALLGFPSEINKIDRIIQQTRDNLEKLKRDLQKIK